MNNSIEPIQSQIDKLLAERDTVLVAIDGSCTAGKTTLAGMLSRLYDCNVFHMDDFFLRPEQRTPQRYAEVGGNVDYERFQSEILLPLKSGLPFSYRPFDCSTFTLSPPVEVVPKKLNIIEGTYCLHPFFGDPYDLKIFLSITPELQRQRILERPVSLQKRFFEEWIPMEQRYFAGFHIAQTCHLLLNASEA